MCFMYTLENNEAVCISNVFHAIMFDLMGLLWSRQQDAAERTQREEFWICHLIAVTCLMKLTYLDSSMQMYKTIIWAAWFLHSWAAMNTAHPMILASWLPGAGELACLNCFSASKIWIGRHFGNEHIICRLSHPQLWSLLKVSLKMEVALFWCSLFRFLLGFRILEFKEEEVTQRRFYFRENKVGM